MKKQINPTIKAHLVRGAFYLLLLLAVCAIPFALAQRNKLGSTKGQATKAPRTKAQIAAASGKVFQSGAPASLTGRAAARNPATGQNALPDDVQRHNLSPWTQAAPVAIDHYGGFMDSDGTFAYEGGGYSFSAGDNINTFARFDPVANTWIPLAVVPDLNNLEASGVYAPNVNKLFVFGGEEATFALVVNTTRIYDIATNTWSTGTPMPDIRAFMASGYFNGKIYLVGGYSTGNVDHSFGQG